MFLKYNEKEKKIENKVPNGELEIRRYSLTSTCEPLKNLLVLLK